MRFVVNTWVPPNSCENSVNMADRTFPSALRMYRTLSRTSDREDPSNLVGFWVKKITLGWVSTNKGMDFPWRPGNTDAVDHKPSEQDTVVRSPVPITQYPLPHVLLPITHQRGRPTPVCRSQKVRMGKIRLAERDGETKSRASATGPQITPLEWT